jgi:hypothetical protein
VSPPPQGRDKEKATHVFNSQLSTSPVFGFITTLLPMQWIFCTSSQFRKLVCAVAMKMTMNDELVWKWKDTVLTYRKLLPPYLLGETEEKHLTIVTPSEYSNARPSKHEATIQL